MPKITEGTFAIGGLFAVAIWVVIVLPIYYGPQQLGQQKHEATHEAGQTANAKPDGSATAPFVVQVIPSPKSAEERAQETEDRDEKKIADKWLVRWTFALFAATIGLILATGVLGYFAYRQSRDMQASIHAAEEANRINRESLVANNRAWLSIDDVKLHHPSKFAEEGFVFRVSATVKNFGKTPARSVWVGFESYYPGSDESFMDAEARAIEKARTHWEALGKTIFPEDSLIQRELWADDATKISKSITTRPSGERKGGFVVFITVSYRIVADDAAHVTHEVFGMLNVPMGTELAAEHIVDLPAQPFHAGQAT